MKRAMQAAASVATCIALGAVACGAAAVETESVAAPSPEKPFFPIGMYCVEDTADFAEIAQAGFNLVQAYRFEGIETASDTQAREYLDAAQASGLRVLMGIPQEAVWGNTLDVIERRVRILKDHPALWGWTLFDEPENPGYERGEPVVPGNFLAAYHAIKDLDPIHPVLFPVAVTPDEDYPYTDGGDIIVLQYSLLPPGTFPWPWDSLASSRDALFPGIAFLAAKGKSALVVIQAYNLANDTYVWPAEIPRSRGRYPTREEMRFSAYASLIYGSPGILFGHYRYDYGEGLGGDDISRRANPRQWSAVSSVASELNAMSAVLSEPTKIPEEAGITLDRNAMIEGMAKEYQGKTFLFIINPSLQADELRIHLAPDRFPDPGITLLPTRRQIPLNDEAFTDRWAPYEVRIYEIAPRTRDRMAPR